ncbi:putative MFS transporter [Microthyrium microscopicum]|uniref:Putative MFS transporter n=1 Tax=Microthyrium microscopicum TaxID=703497 RepID=A0A6A6UFZ5_9PEZI|nr:putative MFS transporter [Microthyrium microscopicum]
MGSGPNKSDGRPRLPVAQLSILAICRLAEPMSLTSVFPYLPEMIESFDVPPNEVGKWAGIISAIFSIAQCCTAIPWGRASDRYGRKPMILLAMTCAMTSSILFGFSRSIWWAIFARVLSGASAGNVGILRTTVAEMVPYKELQPRAFSTMPLVGQFGTAVGPMIGGALASPVKNLPAIFGKSKLFTMFPYLLPNLASGIMFTFGITVGWLFLKESLETKKYDRDRGREIGQALVKCTTRKKGHADTLGDYESLNYGESGKNRSRDTKTAPVNYRAIFTHNTILVLISYFILAFHQVAYDQLLPVFLHLPVNRKGVILPFKFAGGFGLESGRIGAIFTAYGAWCTFAQFTIFPPLVNRYGLVVCLRWATLIYSVTYVITPFTVLMPTPFLQQSTLLLNMFAKSLGGIFAFPGLTILLTNSATSLQVLGTLNGIATSIAAIGRACGPFIAGQTLTWSISAGYIVAAFWLLAIVSIFGHLLMYWIENGDGFGDSSTKEVEVPESIMLDGRVVVNGDDDDDSAVGLLDSDSEDEESEYKMDIPASKELKT